MRKNVTIFKKFNVPIGTESLDEVMAWIQQGKYKIHIESIRTKVRLGNVNRAKELKEKLEAFTPSGTFVKNRRAKSLGVYSNHIVLDFDKVENFDEAFSKVCEVPFTKWAFMSPSGIGFKVIVEVESGPDQHGAVFYELCQLYESKCDLKIDRSGKDVSRLCFVSYDPHMFANPNPLIYQPKESAGHGNEVFQPSGTSIWENRFQQCVDITQEGFTFEEGSRNSYIHHLACNCNRYAIPYFTACDLIMLNYTLDSTFSKEEVNRTILSAYQSNTCEHGKSVLDKRKWNTSLTSQSKVSGPTFPEMGKQLPKILADVIKDVDRKRERDILLLGTLSLLGSCFSDIYTHFGKDVVYPNLQSFIIAPPVSGKGVLKHVEILASGLDEVFKKKEDRMVNPLSTFLIPGNISSAKLYDILKANEGVGFMIEAEADSMSNALNKEYGDFSDLIRKNFHAESASKARKKDNELIRIEKLKFGFTLTGTPDQVKPLVTDVANGTSSRIAYYRFHEEITLRNPFAEVKKDWGENMKKLSEEVSAMYLHFAQSPFEFQLSNIGKEGWLSQQANFLYEYGEDRVMAEHAIRIGIMTVKIGMILTALRMYESGTTEQTGICSDEDWEIALKLASVLMKHTELVINEMRRAPIGYKRNLLDELPTEVAFERKDAVEIGRRMKISDKTVDNRLSYYLERGYLEQPKYGFYKRVR